MRSPASARPDATSSGISSNAQLAVFEGVQDEPECEERGRHRPRHDDLELPELVERLRLSRNDDRPVAGADARTVWEERVVLLNERIRGKRDRGDLETAGARPLVQRLDVAQDLLELVTAGVDEIRRERPVHERVVGIGTVADADMQAPDASTALPSGSW